MFTARATEPGECQSRGAVAQAPTTPARVGELALEAEQPPASAATTSRAAERGIDAEPHPFDEEFLPASTSAGGARAKAMGSRGSPPARSVLAAKARVARRHLLFSEIARR
jgi:hypothetical protein